MTRKITQEYHLRWFFTFIERAISSASDIPLIAFTSDSKDTVSRGKFFKLSQIDVDHNTSHFYFDPNRISDLSLDYLKSKIGNSLIIGYELSEELRDILDVMEVGYIDIWLHPIRFLDDNFFAFRSNVGEINKSLQKFHLDEATYYLYADKLKVESYMGWDKYEGSLKKTLKDNSALFVGQTLTDKAVCHDGKMLTVLDFEDEFSGLCSHYDHVYFSRHPLLRGDDSEQLEFLKSFSNVTITKEKGYRLLASTQIKHVAAVSSSLVFESAFFNKSTQYFYRPVVPIYSLVDRTGYYSVYGKLHSPKFWRDILKCVFKVRRTSVDVNFMKEAGNYRNMLSLFYNNDVFEKDHAAYLRSKEKTLPAAKGKSLTVTDSNRGYQGYSLNSVSLNKLSSLIDNADTVSFDIFDTLLERCCYLPSDVISILADTAKLFGVEKPQFIKARKDAKKYSEMIETPLEERYDIIANLLNLESEKGKVLYNAELKLERKLLRPKDMGIELYRVARDKGKRIIIVSDTYFDRDFILSILDAIGVTADAIYLSSEINKTKEDGSLFPYLRQEEVGEILHIGDNKISDYDNAKKAGVESAWVVSGLEHVKRSVANFTPFSGGYSSIRNGLVRSNISRYPAIAIAGGYTSGRVDDLGYNVIGDVMVSFAAWIVRYAQQKNLKKIFFLARDGEIIKKVVDVLIKNAQLDIDTVYLLASRRSLRVIALEDSDSYLREVKLVVTEWQKNPNPSELTAYLSQRFGLSLKKFDELQIDALLKLIEMTDTFSSSAHIQAWLTQDKVVNAVLENAAIEREIYCKYLEENGLTSQLNSAAFVDIGHNGSLQASLVKILKLETSHGLYFATYYAIDGVLAELPGTHEGYGFYRDRADPSNRSDLYIKYSLLLESLFLNDKGSFVRFATKNHTRIPIYAKGEPAKRINFNKKIHDGVVRYADELFGRILDIYDTIDLDLLVKNDDVCLRLYSMFSKPTVRDAEVFSGITFENLFAGRANRYFVPNKHEIDSDIISRSIWREGTDILLRKSAPLNDMLRSTSSERKIKNSISGVNTIESSIIRKLSKNERKYWKYVRDPDAFFFDSKHPLVKFYGSLRRKIK